MGLRTHSGVWTWGGRGRRQGREGPVLLPRRPRLDPAPHHLDLILRQLLVGVFGRHPQGGIRVSDPLVDEARLRVPRRDRRPGRPLGEDSVFQVQPQIRQPGLGVRAVALETGVGKDGAHLRLKVHRRLIHRPPWSPTWAGRSTLFPCLSHIPWQEPGEFGNWCCFSPLNREIERPVRPVRGGLKPDTLDDVSGDAPAAPILALGGRRVGVPDQVLDFVDGDFLGLLGGDGHDAEAARRHVRRVPG